MTANPRGFRWRWNPKFCQACRHSLLKHYPREIRVGLYGEEVREYGPCHQIVQEYGHPPERCRCVAGYPP